jgi:di/tricarboxylate transporter
MAILCGYTPLFWVPGSGVWRAGALTPQGGSQNVIFVGSNYLTQGELYRLGLLTTGFCLLVFLVLGTPWLLCVAR